MNPLVPTPDSLPVAWGWFQFLLLLTLPLHLLCMNALFGGAGIALYARLSNEPAARRLAGELARILPVLVAFTINFGVAPLLFNQVLYGHFLYVSSVLMAVFWLAVIPLLILVYYALYGFEARYRKTNKTGPLLLAFVLAGLAMVAFIYTNNMTLMLDPERWTAYFQNDRGTLLNLGEPTLLPRYLHMLIGALAVGGLAVALFGRLREKADRDLAAVAMHLGTSAFIIGTLLQIPVGIWFLLAMPRSAMLTFMGGNPLATALFVIALLLVPAALLAAVRRRVYLAAGCAVGLVVLMSILRAYLRSAYHEPYFSPTQLEVMPQYGPMVMFFAALLAGLACIAWLVRQAYLAYRPD